MIQDKFLKFYKPLTPSLRHRAQINLILYLEKKKPLKWLIKVGSKTGGRNNFGRITSFNKGGGHKKKYRNLSTNFKHKFLPYSIVDTVEQDPFKSAFICCCFLKETGNFKYILAPQNIKKGMLLVANYGLRQPSNGSPCLILYAQVGDLLYNINLNNGPLKNRIASSAGTFSKVVKKNVLSFYSIIKKPSGILYSISFASLGFLGKTSNPFKRYEIIGKAGRNRWKGVKPSVRGVAMNPVDHPHGGGEGKSSGGRPSVTPWGFPTKGKPTRRIKKDYYLYKTKKN